MDIAVEEDGDEVFTPMPTHCERFGCNYAVDYQFRTPTMKLKAPLLQRSPEGFMVCPKCHCSYGRAS